MQKTKKKHVKICPICYSPDNYLESNPASAAASTIIGGNFSVYHCNNCGFSGSFFPEAPIDNLPEPKKLEDIKEESYTKVDVSYGKAISGLWKVFAPLGVILSLIAIFFDNNTLVFSIVVLPVTSFLTFYAYFPSYFKKYRFLRIVGIILILYAITAQWVILMLIRR